MLVYCMSIDSIDLIECLTTTTTIVIVYIFDCSYSYVLGSQILKKSEVSKRHQVEHTRTEKKIMSEILVLTPHASHS